MSPITRPGLVINMCLPLIINIPSEQKLLQILQNAKLIFCLAHNLSYSIIKKTSPSYGLVI